MFQTFKPKSVAIAAAVAIVITSSACTTPETGEGESGGSHMSRVRLYDSIEELAADSALVVVGTVQSQRVVADIDPITDFTLSTFAVREVVNGDPSIEGTTLTVRQVGSKDVVAPSELLAEGDVYLLYLTASGLDGKLAEHYYVTGANAGIYVGESGTRAADRGNSNETFVQYSPHEGEILPSELNIADAGGQERPS